MVKVYSSPFKSFLLRNGYSQVSNLLFDYQKELDISDGELLLILRIIRNKNNAIIHDEKLDPTVSSKTLSRRRNSLKEKGLLNFSVVKKQEEIGFSTKGISYDLSPLEDKLQEISDILEEKQEKELNNYIKQEKFTVEEEDLEPLDCFIKDYEKTYGKKYNPSKYEIDEYNKLDEDSKKAIAYIFKYCTDKKILGEIVPRLSLFFKTKFRYNDLINYFEENFKTDEIINNDNLILEQYSKYYDDINQNPIFYKAVERIVNRYAKNNKLDVDISKLLDKAFENTYTFCRR